MTYSLWMHRFCIINIPIAINIELTLLLLNIPRTVILAYDSHTLYVFSYLLCMLHDSCVSSLLYRFYSSFFNTVWRVLINILLIFRYLSPKRKCMLAFASKILHSIDWGVRRTFKKTYALVYSTLHNVIFFRACSKTYLWLDTIWSRLWKDTLIYIQIIMYLPSIHLIDFVVLYSVFCEVIYLVADKGIESYQYMTWLTLFSLTDTKYMF